MTTAEFVQMLRDIQWLTERLRGKPLTEEEIEQMAERLAAAQLLIDGKTYAQVIEEVEISSATLSRVSRCVQFGTGYTRVLKPTEKKEPEKTE